jgi:hypothetical protein
MNVDKKGENVIQIGYGPTHSVEKYNTLSTVSVKVRAVKKYSTNTMICPIDQGKYKMKKIKFMVIIEMKKCL